ncbi:linoleate 9S-lipoxygenase 1 [Cladorrhinum sp. PSN259]|nr:linoleate 9S-lipoxygenase 1 [Cladorrhinum sp. PSN259]
MCRNDQSSSPLFSKLPPELRTAIYVELFGGQRVHLDFMAHPIRADKVGNRKRWRHGICEQHVAVPFGDLIRRPHHCLMLGRRRVLDIAFIFSCRRALDEAIPVLYQSNVFIIINTGSRRRPADDIRSLQAKTPKNWPLVRCLEIKWEVAAFDRNHANMVPHIWGREGYEALWDALAEMPALAQLRIALLLPRFSSPGGLTSTAELGALYFGPIKRLTNVRSCEVILPKSYCLHLGMHQGDSCLETDGHAQVQISWANEDDERPLSLQSTPLAEMRRGPRYFRLLSGHLTAPDPFSSGSHCHIASLDQLYAVTWHLLRKLDKNLPIPHKTLASNQPTQHTILKHLTEKEYHAQVAPQAVKDLPLLSFDPGVFDNELLKLKLYATLDPNDPSQAKEPEGNIRQGTYRGTQVALTQAYSRIEQTFSALLDVLGIEPTLPRYISLEENRKLYTYSAYPKNPEGSFAQYPPHLEIIPPDQALTPFGIFNTIGLVETQIILQKITPDEDGFIGKTKEWLLEKARAAAYGGNPEKGITIQDIVDYNKYHRKIGTDINNGGNIGLLDDWYSDRRFADQSFTGTNPTTITQASTTWVQDFIKAAKGGGYHKWVITLEKADKKSLFVQDGSYFRKAVGASPDAVLTAEQSGTGGQNWAVGTVTLFQLHEDGKLHPIAICIDYKGSLDKSITIFNQRLSPNDSTAGEEQDWPWRYAKTCAQVTDWMRHELTVHLCLSHLVEEAIIVATNRTIPMHHPVYRILSPHWYKTLSLNAAARASLVPQVIADVIGLTPEQAYSFIRDGYDTYDFVGSYVPNDLQRRGFPSTQDGLEHARYKNYPYAKNVLALWTTLRSYVDSMIKISFPTNDSVARDKYIQDWAKEVQTAGHMPSFPEIKTVDSLVDVITMCIHTASPLHTAVNYLQNFYQAFVIAKPPALCRAPPTSREELLKFREHDLVQSLPINRQRQWLLAAQLPWLLSFKVDDERSLLNYAASQWHIYKTEKGMEGERIKEASQKLYTDLQGLQTAFFRNSSGMDKGSIPYMVLDPGLTAVSILI